MSFEFVEEVRSNLDESERKLLTEGLTSARCVVHSLHLSELFDSMRKANNKIAAFIKANEHSSLVGKYGELNQIMEQVRNEAFQAFDKYERHYKEMDEGLKKLK